MYKRMLVPLDGSELAEVVFTYAKELAGRLDLDLTLLHVCVPGERELASMHRVYVERAAEIIGRQSEEVQRQTGIESGGRVLEVRAELAEGHPAEEILRYADENDIDLILIASHGRSGVRRWAMGSVADKVLRSSKIPVWLAQARIPQETVYDKWPSRTLLVPLDGSELAESVLPHVEALARQRGAELVEVVLIRVCETPFITADYPEASMPLTWEEHVGHIKSSFKLGCEQYLQGVAKRLSDAGLKVRSEVLMGDVANEIVAYATKNPFNLIAMSTHGRSGVSRWAYGSVANKVLHGVSSPIFLVRPH
jgi:nucleotide-binding universal stress UspA family protein